MRDTVELKKMAVSRLGKDVVDLIAAAQLAGASAARRASRSPAARARSPAATAALAELPADGPATPGLERIRSLIRLHS